MRYIIKRSNLKVASDKRWLTRHGYSKLAVKVFGYLCKLDDVSDNVVATHCKVSATAYKDAKRELVYAGLIEVYKLNPYTLLLLIGDYEVSRRRTWITERETLRTTLKALESIGVVTESVEDASIEDISFTNIPELVAHIALPKPLNISPIF